MKRAGNKATGPACVECGAAMRSTREAHRYSITANWAISIVDAEILRCPKCGTSEVVIAKPDALQRTIASAVIRKPSPLSGDEMVFLRRCLKLTGRAMSRSLGIAYETLSRYENNALPVPPTVDRLVRLMVAVAVPSAGEKFPFETLAGIEAEPGVRRPLKLMVRVDPKGIWRRAA